MFKPNENWEKHPITINIKNEKFYTHKKETKFIVVLAGGLDENGKIHNFVNKRLDKAIELYLNYTNNINCKIICMGGGTYHKPPFINNNSYVVHESSACANYLVGKNICKSDIYREWYSYDTIANGFFFFSNYCHHFKINNIDLITSKFHINRTKTIFNYFNNIFLNNIEINYISTENYNIDNKTLAIRQARENESNEYFIQNIVNIFKTLEEFSKWFYEEHNAYKAIINFKLDENINKTY